mmetsp:Transcript_14000/g.28994  ORF Transcript_14000/g.28994 Transcript_14000/m.28994 type:complete len:209 (-) Transcript_14000:630-1256(-)
MHQVTSHGSLVCHRIFMLRQKHGKNGFHHGVGQSLSHTIASTGTKGQLGLFHQIIGMLPSGWIKDIGIFAKDLFIALNGPGGEIHHGSSGYDVPGAGNGHGLGKDACGTVGLRRMQPQGFPNHVFEFQTMSGRNGLCGFLRWILNLLCLVLLRRSQGLSQFFLDRGMLSQFQQTKGHGIGRTVQTRYHIHDEIGHSFLIRLVLPIAFH